MLERSQLIGICLIALAPLRDPGSPIDPVPGVDQVAGRLGTEEMVGQLSQRLVAAGGGGERDPAAGRPQMRAEPTSK